MNQVAQVIEPDVKANDKQRYCQSCLSLSDWHTQSGVDICHTCGQPLDRNESLPEVVKVQDEPAKLPPLTLPEMKKNTETNKTAFEKLEKQLNKIRQQKFDLLESGESNEKILELSLEDENLSKLSNSAYEIWQVSKKNFEAELKQQENKILAEGLLNGEYAQQVNERAEKGNILYNYMQQLNELLNKIDEMSIDFEQAQIKGLSSMEFLCSKLKSMDVWRIGNIEIPQIKSDSFGSIKPVRDLLSKEIGLSENNLAVFEKIISRVRKSINFHLLVRGD